MARRPDGEPLRIKSRQELQEFPLDEIESMDLPWNYRATQGCLGVVLKPYAFLTGQRERFRRLDQAEREELHRLREIAASDALWDKLSPLEQLSLEKRASVLTERYVLDAITSSRKRV